MTMRSLVAEPRRPHQGPVRTSWSVDRSLPAGGIRRDAISFGSRRGGPRPAGLGAGSRHRGNAVEIVSFACPASRSPIRVEATEDLSPQP